MPSLSDLLIGALALAQGAALVVLLARLARGRRRPRPVQPVVDGIADTSVSVVVPTRNEARRIHPCLDGLHAQGMPLVEVLVVDGGSTDGSPAMIDAMAARDGRFRRLDEPPRPAGRVGRPWAIAAGCAAARGEWVLVVDADVAPRPGMVAGVVAAARAQHFDAVSFGPRIVAPTPGAAWLQPAFLTTLVYRFGPPGETVDGATRAMANGQCLLMRRDVLERAGGYAPATSSYCDDVRIVRHLAAQGARVGFLDGAPLLDVTMYPTARETWRAWPPSLNMRDATAPRWRWADALFLLLAQALPVVMLAALATLRLAGSASMAGAIALLFAVNLALLLVRVLLLAAMRGSFARPGMAFWLSPLADPAAALRVVQASLRPVREWRGTGQPVPISTA